MAGLTSMPGWQVRVLPLTLVGAFAEIARRAVGLHSALSGEATDNALGHEAHAKLHAVAVGGEDGAVEEPQALFVEVFMMIGSEPEEAAQASQVRVLHRGHVILVPEVILASAQLYRITSELDHG